MINSDDFRPYARATKRVAFSAVTVFAGVMVGVSTSSDGRFPIWQVAGGVGLTLLFLYLVELAFRWMATGMDESRRRDEVIGALKKQRSNAAQAGAAASNVANRKRQTEAKAFYESHTWKTRAAAARSIADKFNVQEKTADKWISLWKKELDTPSA